MSVGTDRQNHKMAPTESQNGTDRQNGTKWHRPNHKMAQNGTDRQNHKMLPSLIQILINLHILHDEVTQLTQNYHFNNTNSTTHYTSHIHTDDVEFNTWRSSNRKWTFPPWSVGNKEYWRCVKEWPTQQQKCHTFFLSVLMRSPRHFVQRKKLRLPAIQTRDKT